VQDYTQIGSASRGSSQGLCLSRACVCVVCEQWAWCVQVLKSWGISHGKSWKKMKKMVATFWPLYTLLALIYWLNGNSSATRLTWGPSVYYCCETCHRFIQTVINEHMCITDWLVWYPIHSIKQYWKDMENEQMVMESHGKPLSLFYSVFQKMAPFLF